MNNEDKILQMLTEMLTEQKAMKNDIAELRQGQDELRQDVTVIKLTQENTILPNIQLLAEGHMTIQNQIKNLSVMEHMQDDIATLKSAVKFLSQEVDKLNKAI